MITAASGSTLARTTPDAMTKRLVYICDWLPPDFGAVGQYAVLFARQWASEGWVVTLVGLTSRPSNRQAAEPVGNGSLEVLRIHRHAYKKQKFVARLVWTVISNVLLLAAAFRAMRRADAVLFTGSPPLMVHFIAPLNFLLRKQLIYRITNFHPECAIAEKGRSGPVLHLLLRLTHFWRRRIDAFQVLGVDQARRLTDSGIVEGRIRLKRDPSPVNIRTGAYTFLYRCRTSCAAAPGSSFTRVTGALRPPTIVEPNGVDADFGTADLLRGEFRQRHRISEADPLVLFLGRLHPKKGLEFLISAFAALRHERARLVIAGSGESHYTRLITRLIHEAGVGDRATVTAHLSGNDRFATMVDADLFVLPSHQENFGIAVVESLAMGTPVVTSDAVDIHEEISRWSHSP